MFFRANVTLLGILKSIKLDCEEYIVSLDVKSLFTNVPLEDAFDITLKKIYSQNCQEIQLSDCQEIQ